MSFYELFTAVISSVCEILPLSGNSQAKIFDIIYHSMSASPLRHFAAGICYVGAIAAIIFVFRKKISLLQKALVATVRNIFKKNEPVNSEDKKEILLLLTAACPIAAAVFFKKIFERISSGNIVFIIALAVSGLMLFISDRSKRDDKSAISAPLSDAMTIGSFRLMGFIPGISGTAASIFACLFSGFSDEFTGEFTFLTLIPVLAGKAIYNFACIKSFSADISAVSSCILAGGAVFALGVLAVNKIRELIRLKRLKVFSYILWAEVIFMIIISVRG